MPTAILIAGMHRSGTSAATGALQLAGVSLGHSLLAAAADNPKGYFENERAVQIHERLLEQLGSSWDDVRQLPSSWAASDAAREARHSIRKLIEDEFAGKDVWAVKDPRICRFIPLWRAVLDEMGIDAVALMVVRKPAEVAASIAARNGWALPLGELLWMRHVFEAEAATRDLPRSVISYESLLGNPHASLRNAMVRLQLQAPLEGPASTSLANFVDSSYRHHVDTPSAADPFHALMEEAYAELVAVEAGANRWQRVQQIGEQAERLMAGSLPYIEAVADKAARHRAEYMEMEALRLEVQSQLNAQIQWSEEAVSKERMLHERIDQSASKQHALETQRLQLESELGLLRNEAARRDGELARVQAELAQTQSELTLAQDEHARTTNELAQQSARLAALLAEKARLEATVIELEESRRGLMLEKQQLESQLFDLQNSHRSLVAEKQELDAQFAELSRLHDQVIHSRSWKLTRPLRAIAAVFRSIPPRMAALLRGR